MTLGKRGIIFLVLSFIAFVLAIVATPLNMATVTQDVVPQPGVHAHAHNTYTLWKICAKLRLTRQLDGGLIRETKECSSDFHCANDLARAGRAFSIMSIIVLALVCCIVGALDMLCKLPADPKGRLLLIAAAAIAVAFTVITWAIQVALYTNECTGQSVRDAEGNKIGPSAVLFIIASVLMMIATIIAAVVPGPREEVETAAGKAKVVNPDGTVDAVPQNQPKTDVPVVAPVGYHEPIVNDPVA